MRNGWPVIPEDATHVGTARINRAPAVVARPAVAKHVSIGQPSKKPSKYGNVKVNVDGTKFDSRKEARQYRILKIREEAGEISELTMQQAFLLIPQQTRADGTAENKVEYWADFTYVEDQGFVVIDVKSEITRKKRDYVIKRKLMLQVHGITIQEV